MFKEKERGNPEEESGEGESETKNEANYRKVKRKKDVENK